MLDILCLDCENTNKTNEPPAKKTKPTSTVSVPPDDTDKPDQNVDFLISYPLITIHKTYSLLRL